MRKPYRFDPPVSPIEDALLIAAEQRLVGPRPPRIAPIIGGIAVALLSACGEAAHVPTCTERFAQQGQLIQQMKAAGRETSEGQALLSQIRQHQNFISHFCSDAPPEIDL